MFPHHYSHNVFDLSALSLLDPVRHVAWQVRFMKSTMFRYVIEASTNAEMTKWLEAFFAHLKKVRNVSKLHYMN